MNDEMNDQVTIEPEQTEGSDQTESSEQTLNIDIAKWLKQAWEIFKTDILKFIVSALIVGVLSVFTCLILAGPMAVGFYKCILKKINGEDYEYGELFDGIKTQFLPSFILMIAVTAGVMIVSSILSFIPFIGTIISFVINIAVTLVVNYMYIQIAQAAETVPISQLVDMAKNIIEKTKEQYAMFLLWALVVYVIGLAGAVVCCIGALVTWPFSLVAITVSCLDVINNDKDEVIQAVAEEL